MQSENLKLLRIWMLFNKVGYKKNIVINFVSENRKALHIDVQRKM